jgi:diguanylate cyclase (GGDEF)-like protein
MRRRDAGTLPTALIVDDDQVMRMLERETLGSFGFVVRDAADGEHALTLLSDAPPDLVLLDVDMPGIDGFEVCRRIREHWDATEVSVIMVTGMDDVDSINRAYEVGANDFVAKPINWPILGHRARYVLRAAQAARNLRDLEEKQAAIVRAIPDMIFLLSRDGTYLDYKDGYRTSPLVAPAEFIGRTVAQVMPADVAVSLMQGIGRALEVGDPQSVVYRLEMPDGPHHYEARIAPSGADQVVAVVRDITTQILNEEEIRRLAYFDTLTGMPNRQHFIERVTGELLRARRDGRRLALLFLDLDGFKRINDTLGHGAGDYLLQSVAARLRDQLRAGDLVTRGLHDDSRAHFARLGGDEFTVVLPDVDNADAAKRVAGRVQTVLSQPFQIGSETITITASIGISIFPEDGEDAGALLKHADTAMYLAKEQGRNNWQMYSKTLTSTAVRRLTLENDIRRGLEREEFHLVYQPQVEKLEGRIVGVEALLRWSHPDRGFVPPAEFIPIAEDSGLIVALGEWVIKTACHQAVAWRDAGVEIPRVAVNLSARQLRASDFMAKVASILAHTGIDPSLLELELTESILMDPAASSIESLHGLRALGVHFSIDDFGTGYSSMGYVKRFPIGMLKIDQSFVRGLPHDANDAGITTAIVAMARSLELDVIAEGVETQEQLAFLRRVGCSKFQGYLFSPPVVAQKMEVLLRRGRIAVASAASVAA